MKFLKKVVLVGFCLSSTILFGYKKFCYADYPYPAESKRIMTLKEVMADSVNFMPRDAQYRLKENDTVQCFVRLSEHELHTVMGTLSHLDPSKPVDRDLVQQYSGANRVIGWVLEDFMLSQPGATVKDVLDQLK